MRETSVSCLGLWLVLISTAGPLANGDKVKVTNRSHEALHGIKNITKRSFGCLEDPNLWGKLCCLPCSPGKRKVADCTSYKNDSKCEPCLEGKEYTDSAHHSYQCRRCRICDEEHGLEVDRSCTRTQDTKCRCKLNFFCNTSECEHCDPCRKCEHGTIEDCTPTSNTKCKEDSTGSQSALWSLLLLLILIPVGIWLWRKYKGQNYENSRRASVTSDTIEMLPDATNIDLSKYIPVIAEHMELNEARNFVRMNGLKETKIDDIKNDHVQETAEQKVQLLRNWYQIHGKKDAYTTMIKSFRKTNRVLAQKIQEMIQKDISNENENLNLRTEN